MAAWPRPVVPAGLGAGWRAVIDDCAEAAGTLDPAARVEARLDAAGLPRLRIRSARLADGVVRRLVREHQDRLAATCEGCGAPGTVRAGATLGVSCDGCAS